MEPVAMMKLRDHRFLLIGMRPWLRETPDSVADMIPVIIAQPSHLLTRPAQSLWTKIILPAATPTENYG